DTKATTQVATDLSRRVALVIGNSAYVNVSPLKNPKVDANLIKETLEADGFEVSLEIDADQGTMKRAIRDFVRRLRSGYDLGLFYYAGHGFQAHGKNYLAPVDAALQSEDDADLEAIDVA